MCAASPAIPVKVVFVDVAHIGRGLEPDLLGGHELDVEVHDPSPAHTLVILPAICHREWHYARRL